MGLFGTKKASKGSIEEVVEMVSKYFDRRGLVIDGHEVESCEGFGWWITEGSAKIYIFVQEDREGPVIRVNSPILHFPDTGREQFFLKLLEINRDLSGCCLSVVDEIVMVGGQRSTKRLDQEELNELVWNVSYIADLLDDQLAHEYNARVFSDRTV